jgi:hypothetical protein
MEQMDFLMFCEHSLYYSIAHILCMFYDQTSVVGESLTSSILEVPSMNPEPVPALTVINITTMDYTRT